jgi:hypothetical protein
MDGYFDSLNAQKKESILTPEIGKYKGALWNQSNESLFLTWDETTAFLYLYHPHTLNGPTCLMIDSVKLSYSLIPTVFKSGVLFGLVILKIIAN